MIDLCAIARLESHTYFEPNTGCWIFSGCWGKDGYGKISFNGKSIRVHQAAYAIFHGRLRRGHEVDHSCCCRACWNPAHLQGVTRCTNMHRVFSRRRAARQVA
jgi:hypothetical protein